jgi:uncharacterized protein (TIGR02996 family)
MRDSELLLKACRMNPAEHSVRLQLADALEEEGSPIAAAYIRESIDFHRNGKVAKRWTQNLWRGYAAWLRSLFGVVETNDYDERRSFLLAHDANTFIWHAGERRRAELVVRCGLPETIRVTAPMLMDRAAPLFSFPLTRCIVTDRKPYVDDTEPDGTPSRRLYSWQWASWPQKWNTWEEDEDKIPQPLYDLLPRDKEFRDGAGRPWRATYATKGNASLTLEAAALAFGRAAVTAESVPT